MSTENPDKKVQALIITIGRLVDVLLRQNLIILADPGEKEDKGTPAGRIPVGTDPNEAPHLAGSPRPASETPGDYDRKFLNSLRIRFEDFSGN